MTDLVLIAIITGVPATLNAVGSFFARREAEKAKLKMDEVGLRVDGRLTELLDLTKHSAFAAGVKHEADKK